MAQTDDCGPDGPCAGDSMCFKHRVRTIQISPSATPSRRNTIPPRAPNNSWEKGIARDERGMPLLDSTNEPIGLHEMASNRGTYEARVKELKSTPRTPTPPTP